MVPRMCGDHPCMDESRKASDTSVAPTTRSHLLASCGPLATRVGMTSSVPRTALCPGHEILFSSQLHRPSTVQLEIKYYVATILNNIHYRG